MSRCLSLLQWESVAAASEASLLDSARLVASLGCDAVPLQLRLALEGGSTTDSTASTTAADQHSSRALRHRDSPGSRTLQVGASYWWEIE